MASALRILFFLALLFFVYCKILEDGVMDTRSRAARLILNPLSIFGNPRCTYKDTEGLCYGEVECLALAGQYGNFCPGLLGLCCIFYRTCDMRTSQEIAYFRNKEWPLAGPPPETCRFRLVKRSSDYCGIRIEPEQEEFQTRYSNCLDTFLYIEGVPRAPTYPLCARLIGGTIKVDISNVNEVNLRINSTTRSTRNWNLKVTQILCSDFNKDGEEEEVVAPGPVVGPEATEGPTGPVGPDGGGPEIGGGTSTAGPPSPEIISPPAPPPDIVEGDHSRCGIRGSPFGRSSSIHRKSRQQELESTQEAGPLLSDYEWAVPSLNDTLFHAYMGPPSSLGNRVTFGQVAGIKELPWTVAMFVGGRFHCGASIIGEYWILTAAHCVVSYKNNPGIMRLSLGDWDVSTESDGSHLQARGAKVAVHERYSRATLQNDIAVVKLDRKIKYSQRIRPICLPTTDDNLDGRLATVAGWGRNENSKLQPQLHKLSANIISNSLCDQRWHKNGAPLGFIVDTMMCMDSLNGDSCNGDSGGPSIAENPKGSGVYEQVGVVSFGSGSCVDENLPGVYTRVSKYLNWIKEKMVM